MDKSLISICREAVVNFKRVYRSERRRLKKKRRPKENKIRYEDLNQCREKKAENEEHKIRKNGTCEKDSANPHDQPVASLD